MSNNQRDMVKKRLAARRKVRQGVDIGGGLTVGVGKDGGVIIGD